MMSSAFSMPQLKRTRSMPTPRFNELFLGELTVCGACRIQGAAAGVGHVRGDGHHLQVVEERGHLFAAAGTPKEITPQVPFGMYFSASAWYLSSSRPGKLTQLMRGSALSTAPP